MILEVNKLSYAYKNNNVLKGISFELSKGDCLAVLGTNGVGKSTLLKCMNGVLKFKSGEMRINGRDVLEYSNNELARTLSYISQNNDFSDISVLDSVLIGRKPYIKWNYSIKDIEKAYETIKLLHINSLMDMNTSHLSGGEKQKVSIARALAQDTDILLFDEPTSNLDPRNQVEILNTILQLREQEEKTIIITMHDLNQALHVANKFLLIQNGTVLDFGSVEVLTEENLLKLYGINISVLKDEKKHIFVTNILREG
jgi:iron complex transport system ATP-binding protein